MDQQVKRPEAESARRVEVPLVDLHNHILPGIDDGSPSLSCSLDVARRAVEAGIDTIVCTPHIMPPEYDNKLPDIQSRVESLQNSISEAGIPLTLVTGGEVYFSLDIPDRYADHEIPTIGKSFYVLVEFPMQEIPASAGDLIFNLQLKGLKILLAHPERNREIIRRPGKARDLVSRDIRLVMNSGSLIGMYGSEIRNVALELLSDGLISAVSSDNHRNPENMSSLTRAFSVVEEHMGSECAEQLFQTNPRSILAGKPVLPVKISGAEKSFEPGRPSENLNQSLVSRILSWFSNH